MIKKSHQKFAKKTTIDYNNIVTILYKIKHNEKKNFNVGFNLIFL